MDVRCVSPLSQPMIYCPWELTLMNHAYNHCKVWHILVYVSPYNKTHVVYDFIVPKGYNFIGFLFHLCSASTHWGRVTHICVGNLIIIGSDNGLSPSRRQAIIWTNARILLIGTLGINFKEILIEFNTFSFKKMHLKMSSAKWGLFRLGLSVFSPHRWNMQYITRIMWLFNLN